MNKEKVIKIFHIIKKIVLTILLFIFTLLFGVYIFINTDYGKKKLTSTVQGYLSKKLNTTFTLGSIDYKLPNYIELNSIYLEDNNKDSLLYAQQLSIGIGLFKLIGGDIDIKKIELQNTKVHLSRTSDDSNYNFQFIIDAFAGKKVPQDTSVKKDALNIQLRQLILHNVMLNIKDEYGGSTMYANVDSLDLRMNKFDPQELNFGIKKLYADGVTFTNRTTKKTIEKEEEVQDKKYVVLEADDLNLKNIKVNISDSISGFQYENDIKEMSLAKANLDLKTQKVSINKIALSNSEFSILSKKEPQQKIVNDTTIDTASAKWQVNVNHILLANNVFNMNNDMPRLNEGFDANHINASEISLEAKNIYYSPDSIVAAVQNIHFNDQSGLKLDTLHANVSYTSHQISLAELYLRTPNSLIQDKLTISFDSLQNLTKYPEKSTVEVNLQNSVIAFSDVMLAMPTLKSNKSLASFQHEVLKINAKATGTLDHMSVPLVRLETKAKTIIEANADILHVTDPKLMMFDVTLLPSQIAKQNYSSFIQMSKEDNAKLPQLLLVQGHVKGRLNDLAMNLKLYGNDLKLEAKTKLIDMMEPKKLKYDLDLQTLEIQKDLILAFIPKGKFPPSIDLPNTLTIKGIAKGDMQNVQTTMNIGGSFGGISINGFVNNFTDKYKSYYDLILSTNKFLIGSMLKQDSILDAVTMSSKIKGKGFDVNTMQTAIDAQVSAIGFKQYTYQNINIESTLKQGAVQSTGTIKDPNLTLDYTLGLMNMSNPNAVDLSLNVDTARMHVLNLVKDTIDFSTRLHFKSEDLSTDKLNAMLKVDSILLKYNTKTIKVDSILAKATALNQQQNLVVQSPFLQMKAEGTYDYKELVPSLMDYINKFIHVESTKTVQTKPQQILVEGTIYEHPLIKTFVAGLKDYDSISFKGDFNSNETDSAIHFVMKAPYVDYNELQLTNSSIKINSSNEKINVGVLLDSFHSKSGELSKTQVTAIIRNDSVEVDALSKNANESDKYAFGAAIGFENKSYYLHLKERLVLNNQIWNVLPGNLIFYSPMGFYVNDFKLSTNQSSLSIKSDEAIINSPISLDITNFSLSDLMSLLNQDTSKATGIMNGKFRVSDFKENLPSFVGDLKIDKLYVNKHNVGDIILNTKKENDNTIHATMNLSGNDNDIAIEGNYFLKNTAKQFEAKLDMKRFNIATIEGFAEGNISNATGHITGLINVNGMFNNPIWNGELQFVDPAFRIPKLGTSYKLNNQKMVLNYPNIEFNKFTITDSANHNFAISGSILAKNISDYSLSLDVNAKDFIVVNTPRSTNDYIYGFAGINADLNVKGPMKGPTIQGSLGLNDPTDVTIILPQNSANVDKARSVVRFIDRDTFLLPEAVLFVQDDSNAKAVNTAMNYNLNVELSDKASLTMIIDPATGDELKVSGNAKLNIGVDPGGNIVLVGNYDLAKGHYILHYQFLERQFDLLPQSTILFSGNPLDAQLDIQAEYIANTSAIDLVGNELGDTDSKTLNTFNQKIPFKVLLYVKGTLKKLDISFDIKMPDERGGLSNTIVTTVENKLTQLRSDPSAINKQVFSLLVLNRFVGEQSTDFFKGNGGGIEDIARESVSKFLSATLDQIASDLVKGIDIDLNLNSYKDYSSGTEQQRTDLNIGITKRFLDDRLSISIGKNLGIEGDDKSGKSRQQSNASYLPNATINYKLSKDGKYMVRAYSKNKFEVILDGYVVESGLSFLVTMDYEKFNELFKQKKQK